MRVEDMTKIMDDVESSNKRFERWFLAMKDVITYINTPFNKFTDLRKNHVQYYLLKYAAADEDQQKQAAQIIYKHTRVLNMLEVVEEWKEAPKYDPEKKMWEYRGNWYKGCFEAMATEFKNEERKQNL